MAVPGPRRWACPGVRPGRLRLRHRVQRHRPGRCHAQSPPARPGAGRRLHHRCRPPRPRCARARPRHRARRYPDAAAPRLGHFLRATVQAKAHRIVKRSAVTGRPSPLATRRDVDGFGDQAHETPVAHGPKACWCRDPVTLTPPVRGLCIEPADRVVLRPRRDRWPGGERLSRSELVGLPWWGAWGSNPEPTD